jgi:hypothetical protein
MSLFIGLGVLADRLAHDAEGVAPLRAELARINELLLGRGLGTFAEPEVLPPLSRRAPASLPLDHLPLLQRAYAYVLLGEELRPASEADPEVDESVREDANMDYRSHLLLHSSVEGYYVPVDFPEPLFDPGIAGGILGSTPRLAQELIHCADALAIELERGQPTERALERLARGSVHQAPFGREQAAWYALWEASGWSLELGTMIVFH